MSRKGSGGFCSIKDCGRKHYCQSFCQRHYNRFKRHGDPLAGKAGAGQALFFIQDVVLNYVGDDCLIWPFACKHGYPDIYVGGKVMLATRYICTLIHGKPPTQWYHAAHSCGKGRSGCVNPNHLRWATPKENIADKVIHGTDFRGERNGRAKLREADVLLIRAARGKKPTTAIAAKYGITLTQVHNIQKRKAWRFLEDRVDA